MIKTYVPIFEYHDLSEQKNMEKDFHSPYIMHVSMFYKQMSWLYNNGYTSITIDDLLNGNISEKSIVLTFDDGHISNYKLAFPILREFNFTATFFVLADLINTTGFLSSTHLLEMQENNMKIESHSLSHPYIVSLSKKKIKKEVEESKQKLQDVLNTKVKHFSVPYGFYNKFLIQCLKDAGYNSLITENFGYYSYQNAHFHILPRFTIKSDSKFNVFKCIAKRKRAGFVFIYLKEIIINAIKKILGYNKYIYLKSLIIGKKPKPFIKNT